MFLRNPLMQHTCSRLFGALFVILVSAAAPAQGSVEMSTAFDQWLATVELDSRVPGEIVRFTHEGGTLDNDYANEIAEGVRRLVFAATRNFVVSVQGSTYETFTEVTFPKEGFATGVGEKDLTKTEEEFEEGFVRTEFVAFIAGDGVTPEEALRIYTSAAFRQQTSSRTKRVWAQGTESCVETTPSTFVPAMMSCNRITELHGDGFAAQHAQVVENPGGDDFQAVYFKESIKTFVAVPGGLLLHYVNYSRSTKIGRVLRGFVRGKLETVQERTVESLVKVLAKQ